MQSFWKKTWQEISADLSLKANHSDRYSHICPCEPKKLIKTRPTDSNYSLSNYRALETTDDADEVKKVMLHTTESPMLTEFLTRLIVY